MSLLLAGPMLQAVLDRPDEDGPRILFADWLEEIGACEYAEFIRVQCALARTSVTTHTLPNGTKFSGAHFSPHIIALLRRERDILDRRRIGFCDGLLGPDWIICGQSDGRATFSRNDEITGPFAQEFRRGFIESIACAWLSWQRHADAIRKATPLRSVRLTDWPLLTTRFDADSRTTRYWHESHSEHFFEVSSRERAPDSWLREQRRRILSQSYPGIKFELPPAYEPIQDARPRIHGGLEPFTLNIDANLR